MKNKTTLAIISEVFFIYVLFFLLYSCNYNKQDKTADNTTDTSNVIPTKLKLCIQPLGNFDSELTEKIKLEVQKCFNVTITVNGSCPLPDSAYYAPGDIYSASGLLVYLDKINTKKYDKILGLTNKHIYSPKNGYPYWGIFGKSTLGGAACVVSSYRIQLYSPSDKFFLRLVNTIIHELGHAFGLYHCPDNTCVMAAWDQELGWKNIDKMDNAFCKDCKKKISGILSK